jgi:outer membrane protein assembly factor BamB
MALSNSYPQFLGPSRNATVLNGPKLARDWATRPPRLLWRQPIGPAWSGFAVQGLRAVTQEQHEGEECVVGYDLLTGKVVWSHADVARYATTIAGEGPRATPTIVNGRVFALGATGLLNCLDLATGKAIWRRDIVADSHGRVQQWGMAGSPLVFGSLVIVNPGGKAGYSLVAYRTDTGDMVWAAGDDEASYSSPCAGLIGGVSQIVIFNQHAVFGHDPITGRVLWRYPWPSGHPHIAQPLILPGNRLLVSSGYGTGSELVQIRRHEADEFRAERLWKTKHLKAKFNNPVVRDNYVFGLDDGVLVCLDLATGEPRWKSGRYGHGQFVLVPDLLLLTAENGEVALLDPVPVERRELARFSALRGKTWNPPALVGDLLLVRNDQEAACYQLPTEP